MTEVERLNKWLAENHKAPNGEPLFRIVWSDNAVEHRKGEYNDFSGDIYLRTVRETRLTRKYNYISERWVFEMWCPPEVASHPELPESIFKGSYEPVYVFEDKKGNYLAPIAQAVEFIVKYCRQPASLTPSQRFAELEEREEKGLQSVLDDLDTISETGLALRTGGAVAYDKGLK